MTENSPNITASLLDRIITPEKTAAGASMGMNKLVKDNSGAWYYSIMKSMNTL